MRSIVNYNGQAMTQISRVIPSQVMIVYDSQAEGGKSHRRFIYKHEN